MTPALAVSPALSKEIRALLPLWGGSIAALVAASVWRQDGPLDVGLYAYVVGSLAIGAHSIGQEYAHGTLPMLLSQPTDRRRVYVLKFLVSAGMLLTLAALAGAAVSGGSRPERWQVALFVLPAFLGLCLAPLVTMVCRSSLAGTILSGGVAGLTWAMTAAVAWFWFGVDAGAGDGVILGRWALAMIVLCLLGGLLGWRRFARLEATVAASRALHLPRWQRGVTTARRYAPLGALAAKEVHLQQLTLVVAGLYLVGWAILLLARSYIPTLSAIPPGALVLLYCVGLVIMIGALASAEERQHGTLACQLLQPAPAWTQWMVKVGVTFGLALVLGAGLPILLIRLAPHEALRGLPRPGDFVVLILLLTAGSIYISSLCCSGVRAMVAALPVGIGVLFYIQVVRAALGWTTSKLAGPWMGHIVSGTVAPFSIDPGDAALVATRVLAFTLVPLLVWFAFVNHRSSERTVRRVVPQVASIAALITMGILLTGGVLALHELSSR